MQLGLDAESIHLQRSEQIDRRSGAGGNDQRRAALQRVHQGLQ